MLLKMKVHVDTQMIMMRKSICQIFTLLCYRKSIVFFLTVDAWTVAFSPDSRFLASGSHSGKINLFGVDTGKKESCLDTRGKLQLSIAYVSLGTELL